MVESWRPGVTSTIPPLHVHAGVVVPVVLRGDDPTHEHDLPRWLTAESFHGPEDKSSFHLSGPGAGPVTASVGWGESEMIGTR
jgi:hypothetical protein